MSRPALLHPRGQQGAVMMAGLLAFVAMSGLALVALLNMSFSSLRIATSQEDTAQVLRAVDGALTTAVSEIRRDTTGRLHEPTGDGACASPLGTTGDLDYDDGLGLVVRVASRCERADDGSVLMRLRATVDPGEQAATVRGSALLSIMGRSGAASVSILAWDLGGDTQLPPEPPPTTTTTSPATTTTKPPRTTTTTKPTTTTTAHPEEWQLTVTSDWGSGYCVNVRVTNHTASPLEWVVTVPVEGWIYTFWSGQWSQSGNQVIVKGVGWNWRLPPGASTDFGFCVVR